MIRLMLVDDHPVVREGLRFMFEQRSDIVVVEECSDGKQALARAIDLQPDVLLMDLLMPGMDGITAIRDMKCQAPSVQIIVLTSYYEDELIFRSIKAGAISYLLKDCSSFDLVEAIHAAMHGESKVHSVVASRLLQEMQRREQSPLNDLTPREREVLISIAHGLSNHKIASELSLSEPTVRTHVGNLLSKLHLADRTQAAIYALQHQLVPLKDALQRE